MRAKRSGQGNAAAAAGASSVAAAAMAVGVGVMLAVLSSVAQPSLAATACHHGTLTSSKCECDPGWEGEQCNAVEASMKTCADWKLELGSTTKDGEYIIHSDASDTPVIVWCHNMTGDPKEFVTLTAGVGVNYAESYERRIPKLGSFIPCLLEVLAWDEGGRTSFTKLRIDPQTLKVQVDDFTFAEYDTPAPLPLGTARDCVGGGVRQCSPKGRARIDLTGTAFVLDVTQDAWQTTRSGSTKKIRISQSGKVADVTCGGSSECGGGCELSSLRLAVDDGSTSPCADSPCQHEGQCVGGEGGHTCLCEGPWEGTDCGIPCEDGFCQDAPCLCEHDGECSEETGMCMCTDGWAGSECQEYDFCAVVAEQHGGEACLHDGNCHNLLYDVVETAEGPCVFPFTYKGKTWDTCVEEEGKPPWCSLTKHFDEDGQRGDCIIHASKPFVKPTPGAPSSPPSPPAPDVGHQCVEASQGEEVVLSCEGDDSRLVIAAIQFASYGTPTGECGEYTQGYCHASSSYDVVEEACLGKKTCVLSASDTVFNASCGWYSARLSAQFKCGFEVEGEWISIPERAIATLDTSITKHAACGDPEPGASITDDGTISVSGHSSCGDPWWVVVEIALPFRIGAIAATLHVRGGLQDRVSCGGDCWSSNITSHNSDGVHIPAPGVYFGSPTTALKKGGEMYRVFVSSSWRLPPTPLSNAPDRLILAVSQTESASPKFSLDLRVFQPTRAVQGIVASYTFDKPINTANRIVAPEEGVPQGLCTNCPTWEDTGIEGGAIKFDASKKQSAILGSTSDLHLHAPWTVAMWVKPEFRNCRRGFCDEEPLLCTEDSKSGRLCLLVDGGSKRPMLDTLRWHVVGDRVVHEKEWTHVAFALSNTTAFIWVDGYEVSEAQTNGYDGIARFILGQDYHDFYSGHIDELFVFDRVLSQVEVEELAGYEPTVLPRSFFNFRDGFNSAYGLASIDCEGATPCPRVRWNRGLHGLAAYFPQKPSSCMEVAGVSALGVSFETSFTFAAWINPDTTESSLPVLTFNSDAKRASLELRKGQVRVNHGDDTVDLELTVPARAWTHIAIRVSSTQRKLSVFIDGTGESVDLKSRFPKADTVKIGCGHDSFVGWMSDVSFYDHVLSDHDVRQLALQLVPKGISASSAGCDFDSSMCAWNGANWTRHRGPTPDARHGPLEDLTAQSLLTADVFCEANGHTFRYVDAETHVSFDEAKQMAIQLGGYLATITTKAEQDCVRDITSAPVFLGGRYDQSAQQWKWTTGPDADTLISRGYQNFADHLSQHPRSGLLMNFPGDISGRWRDCDDACSFVRGFIMEFEQPTGQMYAYDATNNVTRTEWNSGAFFLQCTRGLDTIAVLNSTLAILAKDTTLLASHTVHVGTPSTASLVALAASFVAINDWRANTTIRVVANGEQVWAWPVGNADGERDYPSFICDEEDGSYFHTDGIKDKSMDILIPHPQSGKLVINVEADGASGLGLLAIQRFTVDVQRPGPSEDCEENADGMCYVYAGVSEDVEMPVLSSAPIAPPANPEECKLRFWYNLRGETWQSLNSCSNLSWPHLSGSNSCSSSDIGGRCYDLTTYGQAAATCAHAGARLCTLDELQSKIPTTPKCDQLSARVWSSTPCDEDSVFTRSPHRDTFYSTECTPTNVPGAKVRCCADDGIEGDPARLDVRISSILSETQRTQPRMLWSTLGGGSEWVEAVVAIGKLEEPTLPFQIAFYGDFVHGGKHAHETAVVAVDSVSFEGCDPNAETLVEEEFQIYQLIRRGNLAFALTSGRWKNTLRGSIAADSGAAAVFAAAHNLDDKRAADADVEDYLELGLYDFKAKVAVADLDSSKTLKLVLNGGHLDGAMIFSTQAATFSGPLLGGAEITASVPSALPGRFTLSLHRQGSALSFFLESTLLHSFDIGGLSLHHVGVAVDEGVAIKDASVALVIGEEEEEEKDTSDNGDGSDAEDAMQQSDVAVLAGTDDAIEHADGTVSVKTASISMVEVLRGNSSNARGIAAFRFEKVPISREDTITNAYIQFTAFSDSSSAVPTLTVSAELSRTSTSFEHILRGAPMKAQQGSQGVRYFLSSTFSSNKACTFVGGTYEGGPRRDDRIRVGKYWTVDGELLDAPLSPQPVIRYLECRLSDAIRDNELSKRKRTTHSIAWQPDPWSKGERGAAQQTPDISSVLNEVVQQVDWSAENAVTVFVIGHSDAFSARNAYAYDAGQSDLVATLHIEYAPSEVAPQQEEEGLCVFPFWYSGKPYYACTEDPSPLQREGDVSKPWCGTATNATVRDFGFCTSHLVSTYGGNANPGNTTAHCAFPFVFNGRTYTDCITVPAEDRNGDPWCSTTLNYDEDGLWGYCLTPTFGGTGGGAACRFPFYLSGKRYTECTTDGGRGDDRPWCFTTDTSETNSQAEWGYCSDGSETVTSWGYECSCPAGFEGHRCERPCSEGSYGKNCLGTCDCKNGADCSPINGNCICTDAWTGPDCSAPTNSSTTFSCNECANTDPKWECTDEDTQCQCAPGWALPFCVASCPEGTYGRNCANKCGCHHGALCDAVKGECDCPPGYAKDSKCAEPCPEGYFGEDCLEPCDCNGHGTCNHVSGDCTCTRGYGGVHCEIQLQSAPIFVNELHYDNIGADVNETIEVAGPAGVSLQGWIVAMYSGRSDTGTHVKNVPFDDVEIPDMQGGMGVVTLSFPPGTLQNSGSYADGVAIVSPNGRVVQFLSWEGSLVAGSGPARGIRSEDIGVAEAPTTPVGYSLQLAGTGTVYHDFEWQPRPVPNTFGATNHNQRFSDRQEEVLHFALSAGTYLSDAFVASLLAGKDYTEDITSDLSAALSTAGVRKSQITAVHIVQARGSGIAVYFDVRGESLPPSNIIVTRLLQMRELTFGFSKVSVQLVMEGRGCLKGTQRNLDTQSCETLPSLTTTTTTTTTATTTTTTTTTMTTTTTTTTTTTSMKPVTATTSMGTSTNPSPSSFPASPASSRSHHSHRSSTQQSTASNHQHYHTGTSASASQHTTRIVPVTSGAASTDASGRAEKSSHGPDKGAIMGGVIVGTVLLVAGVVVILSKRANGARCFRSDTRGYARMGTAVWEAEHNDSGDASGRGSPQIVTNPLWQEPGQRTPSPPYLDQGVGDHLPNDDSDDEAMLT